MAIYTQNPIIDSEGNYDKYAINLATSPLWKDNSIGISVAIRLTPYRYGNEGKIEKLEDEQKFIVYGDASQDALTDADLARCVNKISEALQEFIQAKGI